MQHCLACLLSSAGSALLVTACATSDVGFDDPIPAPIQASFSWRAEGRMHGMLTATLLNGDVYEGPYFQVTRRTKLDQLMPLWIGWEGKSRWYGWDGWGPVISTTVTYPPHALANLVKTTGQRMRCRFTLSQPSAGMAGGGLGRCQLSDRMVIHAGFLHGMSCHCARSSWSCTRDRPESRSTPRARSRAGCRSALQCSQSLSAGIGYSAEG